MVGEHNQFLKEGTEKRHNVKKIIVHERNYKYWKVGYKNVPDDYDVGKQDKFVLVIQIFIFLAIKKNGISVSPKLQFKETWITHFSICIDALIKYF